MYIYIYTPEYKPWHICHMSTTVAAHKRRTQKVRTICCMYGIFTDMDGINL